MGKQKQTLIGVCARIMGTCHSNPELNKVVNMSGTRLSGFYLPCYLSNSSALWFTPYFSTFTLFIIHNPSCNEEVHHFLKPSKSLTHSQQSTLGYAVDNIIHEVLNNPAGTRHQSDVKKRWTNVVQM